MSIIVKSQKELDALSLDINEKICIEFGTYNNPARIKKLYVFTTVEIGNNNFAEVYCNSSVEARGNSSVTAHDNSSIKAFDNSSVKAFDKSSVEAFDNSSVEALNNNKIFARDSSSIKAFESSSVFAYDKSYVFARNKATVEAHGESLIRALDRSSVTSVDNSSVLAQGNSVINAFCSSTIEALGTASVVARENSVVYARNNTSIEVCNNASVDARDNVQVFVNSKNAKVSVSGNARTICMPNTIAEFVSYFTIRQDDKKRLLLYKAVHKQNKTYKSSLDSSFEYTIGETVTDPASSGVKELALKSHFRDALDFGEYWNDLALLELSVKTEDIIDFYAVTHGIVVLTKSAYVAREIPLEECGILGKILIRRTQSYSEQ